MRSKRDKKQKGREAKGMRSKRNENEAKGKRSKGEEKQKGREAKGMRSKRDEKQKR